VAKAKLIIGIRKTIRGGIAQEARDPAYADNRVLRTTFR